MNKFNRSGYWSNIKNNLKKIVILVAAFCLLVVPAQIRTFSHLPLKGLFEVLKVDDIGLGHALLHSKWIESLYQYGEGKPHRVVPIKKKKATTWKADHKADAVANLVRKFWFRKKEDFQLLPTKIGYVANIPNERLGIFFGRLINYVYALRQAPLAGVGAQQGERGEEEEELINELLSYDIEGTREQAEFEKKLVQEREKLNTENFRILDKANKKFKLDKQQLEQNFNIAGFKTALKKIKKKKKGRKQAVRELKETFKQKEFNAAVKKAKDEAFEPVSKELRNMEKEYQSINREIQNSLNKLNAHIAKRRDVVKRDLFDPIRASLEFCRVSGKYLTRATEAVLWALFFHKLGNVPSQQQIRVVNDCIVAINNEFKKGRFAANGVLEVLYEPTDFEEFEKYMADLYAGDVVTSINTYYDESLHYFLEQLGGNFPPAIPEKKYGYEYKPGEITYTKANCFEATLFDVFNILWYNSEKKCYDNSLFSEEVIKNGKGFVRLRQAMKYFYLADKKGIDPALYTHTRTVKTQKGNDEHITFTSLEALKSLKIIKQEELDALDISQVPISYVGRSEIEQEFMNIVSGIPGVIYAAKISRSDRKKVFEVRSKMENILAIFNYFYGTDAKTIAELSEKGIFSGKKVVFIKEGAQENEENIISKAKISVENGLTMWINLEATHTFLTLPNRGQKESKVISPNDIKEMLKAINTDNQKLIPVFITLVSKELLEDETLEWNLPLINLVYYALNIQDENIKLKILEDAVKKLFETGYAKYESFQGMFENIMNLFPRNRQSFKRMLTKLVVTAGLYEKECFKNFIDNIVLADLEFVEDSPITVGKLMQGAARHGYQELALKLVQHPEFDSDYDGVAESLPLIIERGWKEVVDLIIKNFEIDTDDEDDDNYDEIVKALPLIIEKGWDEAAWKIIRFRERDNGKRFDGSRYGSAGAVAAAIKKQDRRMALAISSMRKFKVWPLEAVDFLKVVLPILGRVIDNYSLEEEKFKQEWQKVKWVRDILNKAIDHCKFNATMFGMGACVVYALQYLQLHEFGRKIMGHKTFNCWGEALKAALKVGDKRIIIDIVCYPCFNAGNLSIVEPMFLMLGHEDYRNIAYMVMDKCTFVHWENLLEEVVSQNDLSMALLIVNRARKNGSRNYITNSIITLLHKGFAHLILKLIQHEECVLGKHQAQRIATTVRRLFHSCSEQKETLQEIIEVIGYKTLEDDSDDDE